MANTEHLDMSDLFNLSEEELFAKIGADLTEGRFRLRPRSIQTAIQKGREWFMDNTKLLQNIVCRHSEVRRMVENPSDNQILATAVLDLIASSVVGVSPVTVAVLLAKRGLGSLCSTYWKKTSITE